MKKHGNTKKPVKNCPNRDMSASTTTSLVTKMGQVMAIIIGLGLSSMIASILVSESLSGDAAQMNRVGALRLQAMRISRAFLIEESQPIENHTLQQGVGGINARQEFALFRKQLNDVFSGAFSDLRENQQIERQYQRILTIWTQLSRSAEPVTIMAFDQFIVEIDQLVSLFQLESEKKLRLLRLIQGVSLLLILLVASIALYKINRVLIAPLRRLVEVAVAVGKGNFEIRAEHFEVNELGVLAQAINGMSTELKSTYEGLEERVKSKTRALTQSNRSLAVLYHAASNLTNHKFYQTESAIIQELESALGVGKVTVESDSLQLDSQIICLIADSNESPCLNRLEYSLEKQGRCFGTLVWQIPKTKQVLEWQTQLLQAMADIIATAIALEQNRSAEDRLLIVEERAVIARELHDSLAQSLSYLKVQISLLTRKVQKDVPMEQLTVTIEDIRQGLNGAYQQLRELLTTFRLKFDAPSIESALQEAVVEFRKKCNHPIALHVEIPLHYLSASEEIHVLQIVREALSNVYRHACASNASVSLSVVNNKVCVEIWDDGKGISDPTEQHGHMGLSIMKERAKSLNSEIVLYSAGKGTGVTFEFEPKFSS